MQRAADPSSVDVEQVEDEEAQHIEMVRGLSRITPPQKKPLPTACTRRACAQNLACGVFQMAPQEEAREVSLRPSDVAGPSSSDVGGPGSSGGPDADEAELQQLLLPTKQSAAVSAAKRAGRTLVSEIGVDETDDTAPDGTTAKRFRSDPSMSDGAHAMAEGGGGAGARPRRGPATAAATATKGDGSGGDGPRH